MTSPSADKLKFDGPARYRICVQGQIASNWTDRLEGMAICVEKPEAGTLVCTLEGVLHDQAALVGVLTTLYEQHLPLLSVNCLTVHTIGERE